MKVKLSLDAQALSTIKNLAKTHLKLSMSSNRQVAVTAEQMDQFTLFPKLSPELRGKVWDEVCSEPRIVEVEIKAYQDPNFSSSSYGFLPRTLNPAVLYV